MAGWWVGSGVDRGGGGEGCEEYASGAFPVGGLYHLEKDGTGQELERIILFIISSWRGQYYLSYPHSCQTKKGLCHGI